MTVEQHPALDQENKQLQEQITRFGRQLCNFANQNTSFKKGRADYVRIEAEVGERVDIEPPEEYELADCNDEDEMGMYRSVPTGSLTYKFEAVRERYYAKHEDRYVQTAHALFILSVIGINKNVHLPEHIAEEVMGLPGKEAAREAGLVTLQATTMFKLDMGSGNFSVCDHAEYVDMDGDSFHEAPCSCENNVLAYVSDIEPEEDGELIADEESIKQFPSSDLFEKSQNEIVIFDDIDAAVTEWKDMIHIGDAVDLEMQKERLARAKYSFQVIQEAIWAQAGLTSKQQSHLKAKLAAS